MDLKKDQQDLKDLWAALYQARLKKCSEQTLINLRNKVYKKQDEIASELISRKSSEKFNYDFGRVKFERTS